MNKHILSYLLLLQTVIIGILITLTAYSQDNSEENDYLPLEIEELLAFHEEHGNQKLQEGNYEEAIFIFQKGLQIAVDTDAPRLIQNMQDHLTHAQSLLQQVHQFDRLIQLGDNAYNTMNFNLAYIRFFQAFQIAKELENQPRILLAEARIAAAMRYRSLPRYEPVTPLRPPHVFIAPHTSQRALIFQGTRHR